MYGSFCEANEKFSRKQKDSTKNKIKKETRNFRDSRRNRHETV